MTPTSDRQFAFLTGNRSAALLTHFKLAKLAEQGQMPPSPIVVKTQVTTGLVTRIARHFGCQVVENLLVGFKYIADVLWQLEQNGPTRTCAARRSDFVIASEESHGILVTPQIRDKDAGAAARCWRSWPSTRSAKGRRFWTNCWPFRNSSATSATTWPTSP